MNDGVRAAILWAVVCVAATTTTPAWAQSFEAFGPRPPADLSVPPIPATDLDRWLSTAERLVAAESDPARWATNAREVLWQFARRLQAGRLTPDQETRILVHLDTLAASHADGATAVAPARRMVTSLMVGKTAPDIAGVDLAGEPFRLSDYRGRVVLLVFSAEWCAICHTQAPYERFLLDQYQDWPFALLGVEIGETRDSLRAVKARTGLSNRAFWDAPAEPGGRSGPIASAWNVLGWPATYVIDGQGVIRFVDLRSEDLLKGVRQVVEEQLASKPSGSSRR